MTPGIASADEAENWVDPSTPSSARTITGMNDRTLTLVFSDEFVDVGRSFADGHDTRWTSEDRPGVTNAGLQYYNSSHVTTSDGLLRIRTTRQDADWTEYDPNDGTVYNFSRWYQSGMVTTWNKFCFTSGVMEISFQLPGAALRGGLWPAFWMLGNLVRPNYMDSSNGVWPYSYQECGTSEEAQEIQQAQTYHPCNASNAGRGSPEIDIIEAQPGDFTLQYYDIDFINNYTRSYALERPLMSSSLQVAPGVHPDLRPITPAFPEPGQWYPDLYPMGGPAYNYEGNNGSATDVPPRLLNNYWYGQPIHENPQVWQDGLSCNWHHDPNFYTQQTVLRTEWQTGKDDGYVRWYFGDELLFEVTAETLRGKPGAADAIPEIPFEAMYLILNTDVSPRWGWNGCNPNDPCLAATGLCSTAGELTCLDCADPACLVCPDTTGWLQDFCQDVAVDNPAEFLIDYIRVYQDLNDASHTLGCNPPQYPTRDLIEAQKAKYIFNSWIKDEPLDTIQHGSGVCTTDDDCGQTALAQGRQAAQQELAVDNTTSSTTTTPRCEQGRCVCPDFLWTGPHCQSPCVGDYARCFGNSPDGAKNSGAVMRSATTWMGIWGVGMVVGAWLGWWSLVV
ncbi:hypothetical protein ACA910_020271 [Epithemia clementina (nom. ined.)]